MLTFSTRRFAETSQEPLSCRHSEARVPVAPLHQSRSTVSTFSQRVVSLLAPLACLLAVPASGQLGVAAGLNFDRLGDIRTGSASTTFDNATGYHFGVFYDLGAAPISVRPGVYIRNAGDVDWNPTGTVESFDLTLIEIPVDVRVPLLHNPLLKPYVLAGPVVSFPRSDNEDVEDSFEDFLLSGSVGIGVEMSVPAIGLRLFPELRYAFGLSSFLKDSFAVRGVEFVVEEPTRLSAVMLRLGVDL